MTPKCLAALLGGVAALSLASAGAQDEREESDEPLRCVSMGSIRSTRILDDRRVLFVSARDRVYLNRLDRECLGLARAGTFTYRVQSGARHVRLCATDSITVIETTGRGLNCGLGTFDPLSQDELENLMSGGNPAAVSAPIELPKEEQTAAPKPPTAEPSTAPEPAPQ
jgi:hypothetical protein